MKRANLLHHNVSIDRVLLYIIMAVTLGDVDENNYLCTF